MSSRPPIDDDDLIPFSVEKRGDERVCISWMDGLLFWPKEGRHLTSIKHWFSTRFVEWCILMTEGMRSRSSSIILIDDVSGIPDGATSIFSSTSTSGAGWVFDLLGREEEPRQPFSNPFCNIVVLADRDRWRTSSKGIWVGDDRYVDIFLHHLIGDDRLTIIRDEI